MADAAPDILAANPVGERLKAAREAREMSLDDVANITRVPTRHLQHIERGEWDALPAVTYSVGFARAYANAVGLSGSEIGSELRAQLGGGHSAAATPYYEPADPARVPPRSLALIAGIVALLLVIGYAIWRSTAVGDDDPQAEAAAVETPIVAPAPAPAQPGPVANQPLGGPSAAAASGPVVLTAADDVWLRVYEAGGAVLYENVLKGGDRYEVPSNAQRPQIRTGRPEALRVTVGATAIPQLGPAGQPIGDVSLLGPDLLGRTQAAPAAAATAPPLAPTR